MTMNKEVSENQAGFGLMDVVRHALVNIAAYSSDPGARATADDAINALSTINAPLSASAEPVAGSMTPVHDGMPREGEFVIVYQPDMGDGERYDFDYIEDGVWAIHNERHEFFLSVGGAGAAGPDAMCVGPSEIAPYTHWSSLPKPEAGQSAAPPASCNPTTQQGATDEVLEVAGRLIREAVPATASGQTCFVPKYVIDQLSAAISSYSTPETLA